jgi:membrane protein
MRLPTPLRVAVTAFEAWQADHISRRGAALAYYTLFALGPVLLIAIAMAGALFGAQAARGEVVGQITDVVGPSAARVVEAVLGYSRFEGGGLRTTIVATIAFLLAATGAFLELQAALNRIWRVRPKKRRGEKLPAKIRRFLLKRLRSFALVVTIGFVLIVSLAVSAALTALSAWFGSRLPAAPLVMNSVNLVVSTAVIALLFAAVYRILPDARLRWRDVWTGAAITALLFTLGKELIGLYLGRSATASMFGAAGSIVLLLVWVYYSAQIALYGAEVSRVYLRMRRTHVRPTDEAEPDTRGHG